MTRPVRGSFLKDENGAISDHLRNHVHLTNCIHLKNHMHRQSPILAERSLMRDLIVLQRSRSLRDPSTSPPSWHSPSVIDSLARKLEEEAGFHRGRRSVGGERRREVGRLSGSSPPVASLVTSKGAAAEVIRASEGGVGFSDRSSTHQVRNARRSKGEESSRRNRKSDVSGRSERPIRDGQDSGGAHASVSRKVEPKDKRISLKGDDHGSNVYLKTLSEQLKERTADSEDVESSRSRRHGRRVSVEKISEEPEASIRGYCNGLNRGKRRKFRSTRRARVSIGSRDIGAPNELSVASNSLAPGTSTRPKYYIEEGEDDDAELEVTRAPRNGCGIPWNWSRIHHRGKTFLDMAGRSFSCGLSESRLRKAAGPLPHGQRDDSDIAVVASDHSSSSPRSDSEALPLLIEPSGSQDSTENAVWAREYSGELGIFANHSLRHDRDSDLASEARSGDRRNPRGRRRGRHKSLTQKYMPKTFKDLIGQNLVVQALSNAVVRRKVGLLYIFYGPHGTGKTSCARIFARALNCQSPEHPKPCGICNSCIAHDLGKSRNVLEVSPVGNFDFESMIDLLDNMKISQLPSQYRVFIVDDCDTLPPDSWSAISKVIDLAPRRVVFVLVSTSLDHLPHIIVSRCQKFFFPKLKDADIIYTLQWIATKEDLEIDKDALKLIASRSDGSLRDAEMTLDQLNLLGQRISVPLVQELVGLISDEKLVDLLDLALSADTVNTVKNLREIMEAGVEPLALMSQLATIITDILAGSYVFTRERLRRKFFRRPTLSKEDMEKLRQALKTLSEAEKQLRMSNDRLTWLTAALLQLAPDQQYMLPSSSTDTSFNHSPMVLNTSKRDNVEQAEMPDSGTANDVVVHSNYIGGRKHSVVTQGTSALSTDVTRASGGQIPGKGRKEIEEIWLAVLEKIQINPLKQFMHEEGKLVSVSFGAAPTAQLMFNSHVNKSKAEKFRGYILQAFESVLGSPVTIEIRCESRKDTKAEVPLTLPASENGTTQMSTIDRVMKTSSDNHIKILPKDRSARGVGSIQGRHLNSDSHETAKSEIVEIGAALQEHDRSENVINIPQREEKGMESVWVEEAASSHQLTLGSQTEGRKVGEQPQRQSLVRGKVSLAHVIQQAEGRTQRSGWSRRKAISIAEKLEQENLRLEPRSRSLLCWKASRIPRGKLPHLRFKTRRPRSLLKLVSCGRCLSANSSR
ncbi:protein STICHEL-like 3 [Magnolia sinica]|uniref:protein STICHEL-like 3 n=1 Tax=Magnolia sinica TaxID=86752 RepID=UPI002657DD10|nr:protein STICHEL-like 3 [Magnolia sinica]